MKLRSYTSEQKTCYYYDRLNRTTAIVAHDPTGISTCEVNVADAGTYRGVHAVSGYGYDGNSNLTSVIDAEGRETTYRYDALDRLVTIIEPALTLDTTHYMVTGEMLEDGGPMTVLTYDNIGNLRSVTDALGNETFYRYDAWSRLLDVVETPPVLGFTPDERTHLQEGRNPASLGNHVPFTHFKYVATEDGWQTFITDAEGRTSQTQLDFLGRTEFVALPAVDGKQPTTWFEYYRDSQIKSVTDAETNGAEKVTATKFGIFGQYISRRIAYVSYIWWLSPFPPPFSAPDEMQGRKGGEEKVTWGRKGDSHQI